MMNRSLSIRNLLPLLVALLFFASISAMGAAVGSAMEATTMNATNAASGRVTVETLHENERFWPYRIQLVEPWRPVGFEGRFGWGVGVLVRVEPDGSLRVDFAEHGVHRVPAGATDVIEKANRIRTGELEKSLPNLVVWLSGRLLDPTKTPIRPLEKLKIDGAARFLLVFADPAAPDFSKLAKDVGDVRARPGLVKLLLPQGDRRDGGVANLCRAADWRDAFLLDRFTPAYTRSLLDADLALPAVMLISAEGRRIHAASWSPGLGANIEAVLTASGTDRALPGSDLRPEVRVDRASP